MSPNLIATLPQAARLTRLDPDEILWTVEENGRCDTDHFIVLPSDDDGYFIVRPVSR
jgi:hypothetical protein